MVRAHHGECLPSLVVPILSPFSHNIKRLLTFPDAFQFLITPIQHARLFPPSDMSLWQPFHHAITPAYNWIWCSYILIIFVDGWSCNDTGLSATAGGKSWSYCMTIHAPISTIHCKPCLITIIKWHYYKNIMYLSFVNLGVTSKVVGGGRSGCASAGKS